MKRRARLLTFGAAGLAAAVLAVFLVAHWDIIRDHVEAWRFQLARETEIMGPRSLTEGEMVTTPEILARYSNRSVIFDPVPERGTAWGLNRNASLDHVLVLLRHDRYRVIEQRFPRTAYVVIRADNETRQTVVSPTPPAFTPLRAFTQFQPILWDGVYPRPESVRSSEPPVRPEMKPGYPGTR